eukprot:TRINITY_DN4027_c0_g1_i1.p1 TRINITY_DN4027_c0_g1~~TRINITY_DN4027_c0_g1_i1.p1  ORF type:complete len:304 (+),score=36.11 TRINITY_DN4027_c0_g1_i1:387-1298(+)
MPKPSATKPVATAASSSDSDSDAPAPKAKPKPSTKPVPSAASSSSSDSDGDAPKSKPAAKAPTMTAGANGHTTARPKPVATKRPADNDDDDDSSDTSDDDAPPAKKNAVAAPKPVTPTVHFSVGGVDENGQKVRFQRVDPTKVDVKMSDFSYNAEEDDFCQKAHAKVGHVTGKTFRKEKNEGQALDIHVRQDHGHHALVQVRLRVTPLFGRPILPFEDTPPPSLLAHSLIISLTSADSALHPPPPAACRSFPRLPRPLQQKRCMGFRTNSPSLSIATPSRPQLWTHEAVRTTWRQFVFATPEN